MIALDLSDNHLGRRGACALRAAVAAAGSTLQSLKLEGQWSFDLRGLALPRLAELDVADCGLTALAPAFPRLRRLDASYNDELVELACLPDGLQALDLSCCQSLAQLPPLPPSLRELRLGSVCCAVALPPQGLPLLERLDMPFADMSVLAQAVDRFPTLRKLDVRLAADGADLPLPPALESLTVGFFARRNGALPARLQLLESLTDLRLVACPGLRALPPLPPRLERLSASLGDLRELEGLPQSLRRLALATPELPALPRLPPGLEALELDCCDSLRALPTPLPPALKTLVLGLLPPTFAFARLVLPASLEELEVVRCATQISSTDMEIADLPALRRLKLSQCPAVRLGRLPRLQELQWTTSGLTALPDGSLLPRLTKLDVRGNAALRIAPAMRPLPALTELVVDEGVAVPHGPLLGVRVAT